MKTTKIEWTDKTWNPVTGCTKVSAGCVNCYAEIMARRLHAMGQTKYQNVFRLTMHEEVLGEPLHWKSPHTVFVCSMSDLFHENVTFDFLDRVMQTLEQTPQHNYQILTKRADRMVEYFSTRPVPYNAWLGVSVEDAQAKHRIDYLRTINAGVRFLSCEPLLGDLGELDLTGIDWVIVGGESGIKARPMKKEWVMSVKEQSEEQDAAFFFKQWGTWGSDGIKRSKKTNGKQIDGKIYQSTPLKIIH
jgi:protein gp37